MTPWDENALSLVVNCLENHGEIKFHAISCIFISENFQDSSSGSSLAFFMAIVALYLGEI